MSPGAVQARAPIVYHTGAARRDTDDARAARGDTRREHFVASGATHACVARGDQRLSGDGQPLSRLRRPFASFLIVAALTCAPPKIEGAFIELVILPRRVRIGCPLS